MNVDRWIQAAETDEVIEVVVNTCM